MSKGKNRLLRVQENSANPTPHMISAAVVAATAAAAAVVPTVNSLETFLKRQARVPVAVGVESLQGKAEILGVKRRGLTRIIGETCKTARWKEGFRRHYKRRTIIITIIVIIIIVAAVVMISIRAD